ncbi:MAG: hypothetical protein LBK58_08730 [Prevotellaceae bacterium]|jgi:hypothetical protein|nr:hypothetical protein [Prevotellaceae bacterium]
MADNIVPATVTDIQLDVEGMQGVFSSAPEILSQNMESREKACAAGRAMLENADRAGMSDALDRQMKGLADKLKTTVEAMNIRRKPFTQLITAVQKKFTGLEKEVSETAQEIQRRRDAYATEKIEKQKERERIEHERLERERLTIQLQKGIELKISNSFIADLTEAKRLLFDKFNSSTIDSIEERRNEIESFSEEYAYIAPADIKPMKFGGLTFDGEEVSAIIAKCVEGLSDGFSEQYRTEISALKRELSDKLPSKLRELQELAKSTAEELERLEQEAAEREAEERKRLEQEAAEAEKKAAEAAELRATAGTIDAIAESEVSLEAAPKVKDSYEIEVKKNGGWLLLVQFWYDKEGKNLDSGKIAKYTLERMKRFCEAYALKYGEKIDSPLIEYKPVYKAK